MLPKQNAYLVVLSEITILAQAFRVVQLFSVLAQPSFLSPSSSVVAIDAHVLSNESATNERHLPSHSAFCSCGDT